MNLHNIFFGILLTAGLAVGAYAYGPETFIDEARSFVGMDEETPVFARPPVTVEGTPQAAPVNPASAPVEVTVAPSDPTGDDLLGQTKAMAQEIIDAWVKQQSYVDYKLGVPREPIPGATDGDEYIARPKEGYTSEFSGAFTAEANLPVGTICYGFNTWGDDVTGTWGTGDGQIRSDPCEEDYITCRTSIEVSQDGEVTGSWWIADIPYVQCFVVVTTLYDVYYEGEYVSTEPVLAQIDLGSCEYDDPYYNGPGATETFSLGGPSSGVPFPGGYEGYTDDPQFKGQGQ